MKSILRTVILFFVTFLISFGQVTFAQHKLPYSISWREIASKKLTETEVEQLEYILKDLKWSHTHPDDGIKRFIAEGHKSGLAELDDLVNSAAAGHNRSQIALLTLLQISQYQKPLTGSSRSAPVSGTSVVHPSGYHEQGMARSGVLQALDSSRADLQNLISFFVKSALEDPENTALNISVTGVLASPSIAARAGKTRELLRDYLLLMSTSPLSELRMAGLFGLASFVQENPYIKSMLRDLGQHRPDVLFAKEEVLRVDSIFDFLRTQGCLPKENLDLWEKTITNIYSQWLDAPFNSRITDMGDYNWERMAQGAAAQALLWPTGRIERLAILQFEDGSDKTILDVVEPTHSLPYLDGFNRGNGTGFYIKSSLFEDSEYGKTQYPFSLSPVSVLVTPSPQEQWILMGMSDKNLSRFFDALLKGDYLQVHYGHAESVLSMLKYKILRLPAPPHFYHQLASFASRLRKKAKDEEALFKAQFPTLRLMSIQDVAQNLQGPSAQILPFPVKSKEEDVSGTVFTIPLSNLFAARGLALMGEESLALQIMSSLLPQHKDLSPSEKKELLSNLDLRSFSETPPVAADLSNETKLNLLKELFISFEYATSPSDTRRIIMKWLAGLEDRELLHLGREAFSLFDCESQLTTR